MFPHEDLGDMDLAKGFHYRGDTDEGLAPRFKKDLHSIPSISSLPPVPENAGIGNREAFIVPPPANNGNGAPAATNGNNGGQTAPRRNGGMTREEQAASYRDQMLRSIVNRVGSDGTRPTLSVEIGEALAGQSRPNRNGEHHLQNADQHSG
ncbi:hypothetical protein H0H93_008912 [Arthromyces matolae]|nr:hypothetical protein H0H93_008912 [Arthromyces matolae]